MPRCATSSNAIRIIQGQTIFSSTQWKPGQSIEYTRMMFVPIYPYVGKASVNVGLYSPKTQKRLPLAGHILLVSGRASFELTQKASMAGIPVLAAVSAPSTLAADLADEAGMTLVGFLRGPPMNVYTRPDRVVR